VLQQKRRHDDRESQEAPVLQDAEHRAAESQGGGIRLEHALRIPLPLQLTQPLIDELRMVGKEGDAPRDVRLDATVGGIGAGMADAAGRCG
jgi:hypothetical protein